MNADNTVAKEMDTIKIETDYMRNNCQYANAFNRWYPKKTDANDV